MSEDELDFLPLRVIRTGTNGKRSFDPRGKAKLVQACERPGASVSGLALRAGVNANQLRKWIRLGQRKRQGAQGAGTMTVAPAAFVPVVAIGEVVRPSPPVISPSRVRPLRADAAARALAPARLVAQLPNGVSLELECSGQDSALLKAMIDALKVR